MSKKLFGVPTIAIGIPALNEEANIGHLLQRLLAQQTQGANISEIVVISDGSTDRTVRYARQVVSERIVVLENKQRMGQNATQNLFFERCRANIAILLNADILPANKFFLMRLIQPLLQRPNVGVVGAETIALSPKTRFEQILFASHEFKNKISRSWLAGDNILSCRGAARAFRQEVYKQLRWPDTVPEDAYSFFRCKQLGFEFVFRPEAKIYFRLPQKLTDHVKQSHRYYIGHGRLAKLFGDQIIDTHYRIPIALFLAAFLETFRVHNWRLLAYVLVMFYIHWVMSRQETHASKFEIATSSKRLVS